MILVKDESPTNPAEVIHWQNTSQRPQHPDFSMTTHILNNLLLRRRTHNLIE